ncbi:hypothetical protein SD71_09880, partial [Cohnella kolymensis]
WVMGGRRKQHGIDGFRWAGMGGSSMMGGTGYLPMDGTRTAMGAMGPMSGAMPMDGGLTAALANLGNRQ